ncbi:efflux RND transporter periplasmic adaptor subunit [Paenibacillus sp. GD4]|uniref:efflux RND transporter periplasmic adaptor subunit n=1 Tax=Paenibacillus sp. GD4 TaxID=3068890 RepID=UPI002796C227|nr:efflux RND transporter periplasmic adaptor subunit [Paenibacillus sp. GD4]MDQ1911117.1 efflux RND transporter periplasmic adaptor subunit [Paenibacillus sp. GD4]
MRKPAWYVLLAILVAGAGSAFYVQGQRSGTAVTAVTVKKEDIIQYEQASGRIKPIDENKLYAQAGGRLLQVFVKNGDTVKENQVLAQLDPADTELQLRQLEARLEQLRAEWSKAKEGPRPEEVKLREEEVKQAQIKQGESERVLDKARNDYDAGLIPSEQLRKAQNELLLAQSTIETAKQRLSLLSQGPTPADEAKYEAQVKELEVQREQLSRDRAHMQVIAGYNGTVTNVPVKEGQLVQRGMELFQLADLTRLEVSAEVKETLIANVALGQQALIKGAALSNGQYPVRVGRIAPAAGPSQTSTDKKPVVEVTLTMEQGVTGLLPGYNVDVYFEVKRSASALQVPRSAVKQTDDGTSYVWTVDDSRAVRRPVETGIKNEAFVEIRKGLEAGTRVIVKAPDSLKDGEKVKLDS